MEKGQKGTSWYLFCFLLNSESEHLYREVVFHSGILDSASGRTDRNFPDDKNFFPKRSQPPRSSDSRLDLRITFGTIRGIELKA